MKSKTLFWSLLLLAATTLTARAVSVVEWDKIMHWTGQGSNQAALVVQFADDGPKQAYVWGFRWDDSDYEGDAPTGEDMFRAIARNSKDLLLFTQYTGWMGCTVNGIGYFDPNGGHLAKSIAYDFDGAKSDTRISFDYFNPNELMGQTKAPANFTSIYCNRAIEQAITTNVIEHPINALDYGYPAYDYDWWQPAQILNPNNQRWNAGWYDGYWSYWVGDANLEESSYSGVGYSSRKLSNGQVDGWKYTFLDGPVSGGNIDGFTGASEQWYELNYHHFSPNTAISSVESEASDEITAIYSTNGTQVSGNLTPGVYVVKFANGKTQKVLVK